jgi:hypothetical protein
MYSRNVLIHLISMITLAIVLALIAFFARRTQIVQAYEDPKRSHYEW